MPSNTQPHEQPPGGPARFVFTIGLLLAIAFIMPRPVSAVCLVAVLVALVAGAAAMIATGAL